MISLFALSAWLATAAAAQQPPKPNLLLVTLDTTRADHLGCYGRKPSPSPFLDDLAAHGALFEQAHSHVPLTLPSHAVLLSGQLPPSLQLHVNGVGLRDGVETLATHLEARGYETAAVVASSILGREFGLARGFDVYDDHMTMPPSKGGQPEERRAEEVTDAALRAAQNLRHPFFLWAHYYDPHYDYRPPQPYARRFETNLYDGEIASMDASIGKLLDGLRRAGLLQNTIVVVAGDHGEGLMEHGERQHGVFLYEYALHVPLLIVWEGHVRAGLRIRSLCGLSDVAPTVLELMNAGALAKSDGVSLKPLLEQRPMAPRRLYAESYHGEFTYGWAPLRATISERWKYIDAPKPELYEWRVSEEKNLYGDHHPEARVERDALNKYPLIDEAEARETKARLESPEAAETRRKLESLGYLTGRPPEPSPGNPIDPKDAIGTEEELRRAREALDGGDNKGGKALLQSVLARNPRNAPALAMLGLAHLAAGEYNEAQRCFEEEIRLRPELEASHVNLGTVYKRTQRLDLAEREYRAALAIAPRNSEAAANLAQIEVKRGRTADARHVLEGAIAAGGESADVDFELGIIEAMDGNWDRARAAFTRTVALDPRRHEALANLGNVAFKQGRIDESIYAYERASRVAPANPAYLATLGSLYLNGKDDPSRALGYFRRALQADPYAANAADLRQLIARLEEQQRR